MNVEITKDFIGVLVEKINEQNAKAVKEMLDGLHPADIAELFDELSTKEQAFVIDLLENDTSADILLELEEDDRKKILHTFSAKEIANEVINEMDTDDAVDIINELSDRKKNEVIAQIEDKEQAKEIVELLRYDEDTAGGLMGKELIKVNKDWSVITAIKQMRKQAEDFEEVFSIYVVDDDDVLLGILSLKKFLTTSANTKVEDVYNDKIQYVNIDTPDLEVAKVIEKYDLYEVPVIDELKRLVGVITVDDVLDVIREEAEENYQLAAGITQNVDSDDSILKLTKARLPWLMIGMLGGLGAASIMSGFESALEKYTILLMFVPLIQSTAGNVGIQSSAIVVQGIANGSIKGGIFKRLVKEFLLGLLNGLGIALVVLLITHFVFDTSYYVSMTICVALVSVIINAAIIGTFIPIFLNGRGIDPAVSTGPFITTSNDILGVFIYFMIAKSILGF
ncbi:magnesium transporter [Faecalibacter sp. LW9]|uniref:magnesium transporter n=1 Tax=Faecalibacter sp. LW9 TaxID=3103144 RepID=UPI002AFFD3F6|nr:magnesium transporter [Faecalibacter sp. LW9]